MTSTQIRDLSDVFVNRSTVASFPIEKNIYGNVAYSEVEVLVAENVSLSSWTDSEEAVLVTLTSTSSESLQSSCYSIFNALIERITS